MERKFLRKIYGPKRNEDQTYEIRSINDTITDAANYSLNISLPGGCKKIDESPFYIDDSLVSFKFLLC